MLETQYDSTTNVQHKLNTLKGSIYKLAVGQTGSRFLQRVLKQASSQVVSFILDEVAADFSELMVDNYGNYFCQRLL